MRFDLANKLDVKRGISPAVTTDNTAIVTQIFDTRGYYAIALLILLGSIADADATGTVLVEAGNASNLSDAVAVPDAELIGLETQAGFTFADDDKCRKIGYIGVKRYIRATITPANNTGNLALAAAWVAMAEDAPPPNPPT